MDSLSGDSHRLVHKRCPCFIDKGPETLISRHRRDRVGTQSKWWWRGPLGCPARGAGSEDACRALRPGPSAVEESLLGASPSQGRSEHWGHLIQFTQGKGVSWDPCGSNSVETKACVVRGTTVAEPMWFLSFW